MQARFGDVVYQLFCAACHGETGKGDGPAATALPTRPTDLTALARENDGTFPAERVAAAIDGRLYVVGHINIGMPPWAQLFADDSRTLPKGKILDAFIARRIAHLVAFIESIQE